MTDTQTPTVQSILRTVMAIHDLHRPDGEGSCMEDGQDYPCSTSTLIQEMADTP